MRIALFGAHSTGKTTLAKLLCQALDFPEIEEIARLIADEWGLTPATIPPERVIEYQRRILVRQIRTQRALSEYVSDRSVLCNAAYMRVACEDRDAWASYARYLSTAASAAAEYDLLLYLPVNKRIGIEDDGERHLDPQFQRRIDKAVDQVIHDLREIHGLNLRPIVHPIRSEGPQNRLREALTVIEERGTPDARKLLRRLPGTR